MKKITEKAYKTLEKVGWKGTARIAGIEGSVDGYVNWSGGVFVFELEGEFFQTSETKKLRATR